MSDDKTTFDGRATQNDFQAALDDAVNQAVEHFESRGNSTGTSWKLVSLSGSHAGFAGSDRAITVTIEVEP